MNDFAPISLIAEQSVVLVTQGRVPAKDLKELIAWVKANQDKVTWAPGRRRRLAFERRLFPERDRPAKLNSFPTAALRLRMQDLVAGQIDLMFDQAGEFAAADAGRQDQGICGDRRKRALPAAPEIPTVDEAGLPGFLHLCSGMGFWVPKGTPKDIVATLVAATS